jgi:hypothetical protein
MFVAVNKLPNVCVIMSDLTANYERGRELIEGILRDLKDEANRSAYKIEPVS